MEYKVSPYVKFLLTIFERREAIDFPDLKDVMDSVLETLTPFERECLNLRFGLSSGCILTYVGIANRLKTTPQRVSRHVNRALRKLRHRSRSRKLEPFIEKYTLVETSGAEAGRPYPIEKYVIKAEHGLLCEETWSESLSGYDTRLIRWLRSELEKTTPCLTEKFNHRQKGQCYFGYRRGGPPDKLYIYIQRKDLVIDVKLDPKLSERLLSLGYTVSLRKNWQGRAGWLTGWHVPCDVESDKWQAILEVLLKAF